MDKTSVRSLFLAYLKRGYKGSSDPHGDEDEINETTYSATRKSEFRHRESNPGLLGESQLS